MQKFRFLSSKVLAEVSKSALAGDPGSQKLFFNVLGMLGNGNGQKIRTQNNYILINGLTIDQETIQRLKPDQLAIIENVLKSAIPQIGNLIFKYIIMNEQTLLSDGREQAVEFQQEVRDVITKANELVILWNRFQEWDVITTQDQAFELIKDPVGRLDKFLIGSVDIKTVGPKTKLNPAQIALMLNVDRDSWVNICEGREPKTDCIPCRGVHLKKGVPVITFEKVWLYSNFLTFEKDKFIAVDENVKAHVENFKVYITNPEQEEIFKFWHTACDVLNQLCKKGYLGNSTLISLQQQLQDRITFSYATNQLHVNQSLLMSEILKIQ